MKKIVFLRHGESLWNKENRFTGWTDVDLSEDGKKEAKEAGEILKKEGFIFDLAFSSVLKRAIRTLWIVQETMDLMWIPADYSWRLNERHYGALQGLDKSETARKYGEEQVFIWRRSYDIRPPELTEDDKRHPGFDPKYKALTKEELPSVECLKDTYCRCLPFWLEQITPLIKQNKRIIVSAHGNSIRAIVKYLDGVSDEKINSLDIPTAVPLVYELDDELHALKHYYLGNLQEIEEKIKKVKNQGKA
jgi:2,3-bisphosphoglycerate-dependent phosphoglycerate mutase